MARHKKKGFDYFPLDVDIISDIKIRALIQRHGIMEFMIYIRLLCEIYSEGYALKMSDELNMLIALDFAITEDEVSEVINHLITLKLLDKRIYEEYGMLTSRGIQLRYQAMSRERGRKNSIDVMENLWIIPDFETENYINKCGSDCIVPGKKPVTSTETDNSGKNPEESPLQSDCSGNNIDSEDIMTDESGKSTQSKIKENKINEIKEKESEVNESNDCTAACASDAGDAAASNPLSQKDRIKLIFEKIDAAAPIQPQRGIRRMSDDAPVFSYDNSVGR